MKILNFLIVPYHWQRAEAFAEKGDWQRARRHIDRMMSLCGFENNPVGCPINAIALAAVIAYRQSDFDAVFQYIERRYKSDLFMSAKRVEEAKYIRKFLFQLLEYTAGADSPRQKVYLSLAQKIYSVDPIDLDKVRSSVKRHFPLS